MRDPVVAALFRSLVRSPSPSDGVLCCHTAARFNARGVGESESVPEGASLAASWAAALALPEQRNERDAKDLLDVVAHALREAAAAATASAEGAAPAPADASSPSPQRRRRLWLIGYSHGSLVASRALPMLKERLPHIDADAELAGVVAVAPPLGLVCSFFLDAGRAFAPFARPAEGDAAPRMALLGTRDNFTSLEQLRAALGEDQGEKEEEQKEEQAAGEEAAGGAAAAAGRARVVLLEDADHFFWGRVGEVAEAVAGFVAEVEEGRRRR
jgi:alpha/beta superfamily hydrolase